MSLAVAGFAMKVVGGGETSDKIKNFARRNLLKATEGTCCRIILVVMFVGILIILSLISFIVYNVFIAGVPNAILLGAIWLFKKIWSSEFFISNFFKFMMIVRDFFRVIIDIWNPLTTLGPPFAIFWNVLVDFVFAVLGGIFGIVCTESIFSPSFNIFTSCPSILGLLALAPNLAPLFQAILSFLIELINLMEESLKFVACFSRVGAFIASSTSYSNGTVTSDCSTFCFEVIGIALPGCYNFGNLMRWLFPANITIIPARFGAFLANFIDLTMPFVWDVLRWIAFRGEVVDIYACQTLKCMIDVLFTSPTKIFKVAWGIVINYILAPLDHVQCTIFSPFVINCIANPLCGWMGFPPVLCDVIPVPGGCPCSQALTGWDQSFGFVNSFVSGAPCSLGSSLCHPVGWLVNSAIPIYNSL